MGTSKPEEAAETRRPATPPNPVTPEEWAKLVETFGPVAKWAGDLWKWHEQREYEAEAAADRHALRVLWVLMVFLGLLTLLMAWLTFEGRVSGDALLFLVGTVTGVILTMVQRHLFGGVTGGED